MFGNIFTGENPTAFGMYVMQSAEDKDTVVSYFYHYLSEGIDANEAMQYALQQAGVSIDNFTMVDRNFLTKLVEENM